MPGGGVGFGGGQRLDQQRRPYRAGELVWLAVAGVDDVPEDRMPLHEGVEGRRERGGVQVAFDLVRPRQRVGGVARVELVDEPEAPLGVGERRGGT